MVEKLTKEESDKLTLFIGQMVRGNVSFATLSNKVGVTQYMGIQELYNENPDTLRVFGGKLEKLSAGQGGRFAKAGPYLVGGIVPAKQMEDMLDFMIREKEAVIEEKNHENKIAKLRKDLEGMKTQTEIKSEKQAELNILLGLNADGSPKA